MHVPRGLFAVYGLLFRNYLHSISPCHDIDGAIVYHREHVLITYLVLTQNTGNKKDTLQAIYDNTIRARPEFEKAVKSVHDIWSYDVKISFCICQDHYYETRYCRPRRGSPVQE